MTRVRLYVDEDALERIVVDGLVAAGFDVLTTRQAGAKGASDEAQLRFATQDGRAIYSLNVRDFAFLHRLTIESGGQHCGIILIPSQRYGPSEKLRRLKELLGATTAEELANQIRYL